MDKYEYKICLEDIRTLIGKRDFAQAVEIADTIDWTHVKSVKTLCMISDLYKINGRIDRSYAVLVQAYNRQPEDSRIIYALCDLLIRQKQMLPALQLYNEFTRLAPKDPGRFVLQYRLYELQEVSLDERIAVLKDLERHSFRDKWVFELARLYEEQSRYQDCVAQCDKLIARGKPAYQKKAIQLKQKYASLTGEQKEIYRQLTTSFARQNTQQLPEVPSEPEEPAAPAEAAEPARQERGEAAGDPIVQLVDRAARMTGIADTAPIREDAPGEGEIRVREMDEQLVSTVDLQREVADGLKGIMTRETGEIDTEEAERAHRQQLRREFREGFDLPQQEEGSPEEREEFERARQEAREHRARWNEEQRGRRADAEQARGTVYEADLAQETDGQYSMRIDGQNVVSRPRVPQTTGPVATQYHGEASVPAEVPMTGGDSQAFEEERQERLRESAPKASLSDGMTGQEKLAVALAQQANAPEPVSPEAAPAVPAGLQDTLVLDPTIDAGTKTWTGSAVETTLQNAESEYDRALEAPAARDLMEKPALETQAPAEKSDSTPAPAPVPAQPIRSMAEDVEDIEEQDAAEDGETQDAPRASGKAAASGEDAAGEGASEANATGKGASETDAATGAENEVPAAREHETEPLSETQEIAELVRLEFENEEHLAEQQAAAEAALKAARPVRPAQPEEDSARRAARAARENMETAELQRIILEENEEDRSGQAQAAAPSERVDTHAAAQDEAAYGDVPDGEEPGGEQADAAAPQERMDPASGRGAARRTERDGGTQDFAQDAARPRRRDPDAERIRNMSPEQRRMFAPFLHEKSTRGQLLRTIDAISLASYTGNVLITGEEGTGALDLAKALLRNVHMTDGNFSGKVAVTSGSSINRKGPAAYLERLQNGGLVIDHASTLTEETVDALHGALEKEDHGAIVLLIDTPGNMNRFWGRYEQRLRDHFTTRVDIRALSEEELIRHAERYAQRQDCRLEPGGRDALAEKIHQLQTPAHAVTPEEVRGLIDDAIASAERKTAGHFMDSMLRRRYDADDMLLLRDKDFR